MARMGVLVMSFFVLLSLVRVEAQNSTKNNARIYRVCAATTYPRSCELDFLDKVRYENFTAVDFTVDAIHEVGDRTYESYFDASMLFDTIAPAENQENLTTLSAHCVELLEVADHHARKTATTYANLLDSQAWLSGSLQNSYDCAYNMIKFQAVTWPNTSAYALEFVYNMSVTLNHTIKHASNAVALINNRLLYGDDETLWQPPPETREAQLKVLDSVPPQVVHTDHALPFSAGLIPNATVAPGSSIQAAVDAAPAWSLARHIIHIQAGIYQEPVKVPTNKTNIMFLGDGSAVTVITGNVSFGKPGITTRNTATVAISGSGFVARGITFENAAGPVARQAVAVRVESDLSAFHECAFLGHQDTLYAHSFRQFYKNCTIAGTVDFVFGNAAAVFQECRLVVRVRNTTKSTTTITAQGRVDPGQATGYVFQNCTVDGTPEFLALHAADPGNHWVFLGRPWKTFSRTIFSGSWLSGIVRLEGWKPWDETLPLEGVLASEIGSWGPGANLSARATWSTQLTATQAEHFTVPRFVNGDVWLPETTVPYAS